MIIVTTASGTKITALYVQGVSASEFERLARRDQHKQLLRRFFMMKDRGRKSLIVSMRRQE